MMNNSRIILKISNFTLISSLIEFLIKFWSHTRLIRDSYRMESEKVSGPKFVFVVLKIIRT